MAVLIVKFWSGEEFTLNQDLINAFPTLKNLAGFGAGGRVFIGSRSVVMFKNMIEWKCGNHDIVLSSSLLDEMDYYECPGEHLLGVVVKPRKQLESVKGWDVHPQSPTVVTKLEKTIPLSDTVSLQIFMCTTNSGLVSVCSRPTYQGYLRNTGKIVFEYGGVSWTPDVHGKCPACRETSIAQKAGAAASNWCVNHLADCDFRAFTKYVRQAEFVAWMKSQPNLINETLRTLLKHCFGSRKRSEYAEFCGSLF